MGLESGRPVSARTRFAVPVVEHNGGINGFSTTIVRLVGDKRLIVLLDNTSQGRYLDGIALAITNILYDQPYASAEAIDCREAHVKTRSG